MFSIFKNGRRSIICSGYHNVFRNISSSEVTSVLRPFYFLVHPDLFAQYPRAQHLNDANLKALNKHLDRLINKVETSPVTLKFYVKSRTEEDILNTKSFNLNKKSPRKALQKVLETFNLPTKYIDSIEEKSTLKPESSWNITFDDTILYQSEEDWNSIGKKKALYSWLCANMGDAEKRLLSSQPIRTDILRLKEDILSDIKLSKLSWERGIGTTHLRSCLQALSSLGVHHPNLAHIVKGRNIHFANQTGISMDGSVILSTSEVRDQWLQAILNIDDYNVMIKRIPYMQKAVSNCVHNIQVVQRKYQPFLLANNYSQNLKRLVTSLGDYSGKKGFPKTWPASLDHLQLVVESANGPLMLSPTGQIIAPASCPPWLLVNFITENMDEASKKIQEYESIKDRCKELHDLCEKSLGLDFLDTDDSISPTKKIHCLERLLAASYRLSPLLSGGRVWITHYYSVLLDGEVCIPWDWDCEDVG